jgi:ParB-like nuclease domain
MVRNLLVYCAVCLILVAVVWVAGRLIGLDRPSRGPTGQAWLDAEDAFDRARRQHQRHQLAAVLSGRPHRLDLPIMNETTILGGPRIPTELQLPIRDIVGTAGAAGGKFDRDFLPTDERSRWRFQALVVALRQGETLPPIEVYRLHGRYYVADGHHRVAVARALGEESIAAYVTELPGW